MLWVVLTEKTLFEGKKKKVAAVLIIGTNGPNQLAPSLMIYRKINESKVTRAGDIRG